MVNGLKESTIICGVDPGAKGAFAKIDPAAHTIEIFDMPTFFIKPGAKTKTVIDFVGIGNILDDERIFHLYLEDVTAMPTDGIVGAFSFGLAKGAVLGVCGGLRIPLTQVRSAVWKHNLKVPADKDSARYRASQLFPKCATAWARKMDDGRAEAALLGFYGVCQLGYQVSKPYTLIGEIS